MRGCFNDPDWVEAAILEGVFLDTLESHKQEHFDAMQVAFQVCRLYDLQSPPRDRKVKVIYSLNEFNR